MNIERKPVVECYELQQAIENHFDLEHFNLVEVFFPTAENGTYEDLCIDDYSVEQAYHEVELYTAWGYSEQYIENLKMKAQIIEYLHQLLPNEEMLIVSLIW